MKYHSELINQTHNANIYGLYDQNMRPIGTKEVILSGRNCGVYHYSLTGKYNKRDIARMFKSAEMK